MNGMVEERKLYWQIYWLYPQHKLTVKLMLSIIHMM